MAFDPNVAAVRLDAVRIALAASDIGVKDFDDADRPRTVLAVARDIAAFAEGTE